MRNHLNKYLAYYMSFPIYIIVIEIFYFLLRPMLGTDRLALVVAYFLTVFFSLDINKIEGEENRYALQFGFLIPFKILLTFKLKI